MTQEEMQNRIEKLEKFCFTQNTEFQDSVFENVLLMLESTGLGIGKRLSADNAAFFEITSIKKGLRFSRMTEAQRNTIANPGAGLVIFNTTTSRLNLYDGTQWTILEWTASGTYTPTLTNTTNVTASTPRLATYMRVGNSVTVSGQLDLDPTGAGAVLLGISLPIASAFTTAFQLGGVASSTTIANESAGIEADATNDRASLKYIAVDTTNHTMTYQYTYQVI